MTPRRFKEGDTFSFAGIDFRVVRGVKTARADGDGHIGVDLRLDWRTPTGWVPIPMRAPALMIDFFCENEEVLYPQSSGYQGGKKTLAYMRDAVRLGWDKADAGLRLEKAVAHSLFDSGDAAFVEAIDYAVVYERDGGVCQICAEPIGDAKWHIDHVMPLSRGGVHSYANVQLAHARCNMSKGSKVLSSR